MFTGPCLGAYNLRDKSSSSSQLKPASMFRSGTKRFSAPPPQSAGEGEDERPASLSAPSTAGPRKSTSRTPFHTSQMRFHNTSTDDSSLGPGAYDPARVTITSQTRRPLSTASASFRGGDLRFAAVKYAGTPGPGHYDPNAAAIRQNSFNVSILPPAV